MPPNEEIKPMKYDLVVVIKSLIEAAPGDYLEYFGLGLLPESC